MRTVFFRPWPCIFAAGLIAAMALPGAVRAQSTGPAAVHATHATHKSASSVAAENAASIARITLANQDLLNLLKQQQAVLEDIQFDRRLQSRQISYVEARLEDTLRENAQLQAKVAKLEEQISLLPSLPATGPAPSASRAPAVKLIDAPPAPPSTYLPPTPPAGGPGAPSWHRLFTLSGTDSRSSNLFPIRGRQWRVLWHNQDRPGAAYANTSALFINAFRQDDPIPQKVCSKLGSGGNTTELAGPGSFYLKVEASGGAWELAVEEFK